nr:MAG TPA: hypothetical protein [Caudoviricetes sp.]DAE79977.1 MAG TPA: hypothetical protein [Caudoviricetes sp.]
MLFEAQFSFFFVWGDADYSWVLRMRWDCLIMALRVILTPPSYKPAWSKELCLMPI